jgi:hypothetical protein
MIRRLLQLENRTYTHITILTFVRQISVVMITRQTNINIVIESEHWYSKTNKNYKKNIDVVDKHCKWTISLQLI